MPAKKKAAVYRANTSGAAAGKHGAEYVFHQGDLVTEGHELLTLCPANFDPAEDVVRFDVEQATAAPGEQRGA